VGRLGDVAADACVAFPFIKFVYDMNQHIKKLRKTLETDNQDLTHLPTEAWERMNGAGVHHEGYISELNEAMYE
jgi:hypothetical protein